MNYSSPRRVLVIVAHTDDEALGCAGTLHRHVQHGDEVFGVHLTDGVGARQESVQDDVLERSESASKAADIMGLTWLKPGSFLDNGLDTVKLLDLVQFIEAKLDEVKPDLVYTHHGGDLNIDHHLTFRATLTALRPQPNQCVSEIRTFEVASSTEWSHPTLGDTFHPNLYVDITASWEAKERALNAYSEEMRAWPHSRSVEGLRMLARRRGCEVGVEFAEAFEIIRRVI